MIQMGPLAAKLGFAQGQLYVHSCLRALRLDTDVVAQTVRYIVSIQFVNLVGQLPPDSWIHCIYPMCQFGRARR